MISVMTAKSPITTAIGRVSIDWRFMSRSR